MKNSFKHFYFFKGNWSAIFDDLAEMLQPDLRQKFAIWEPRDKDQDHSLIIVHGMPLSDTYCYQKAVWKTDERLFNDFYFPHLERFIIHGSRHLSVTSTP